jgi:predicted DsbA family dithiol-disulfide isomerase
MDTSAMPGADFGVTIDVFSDPICPWCMIGKRRLDRALEIMGGVSVEVRWRVFQLNPTMPREGMDRAAYLSAKFGGAARAGEIYRAIRNEGAAEGIDFAFERIARTPNTLRAHALIRAAVSHGLADVMAERLFRAYFLEGRDIGAPPVLEDLAAEVGLPESDISACLADDTDLSALVAEDAGARAAGITGVPYFVIDGRFSLSGAVPPEVLVRALELAGQAVS